MAADAWDEAAAMGVLRAAEWPYREYLDLLREVWRTNRDAGREAVRLVGLAPGRDWRATLLPQGRDYDSFMADLVLRALREREGRVLVYAGVHHAFTRYLQAEAEDDGRARKFMVRMGNRLRWELGDEVFVVAAHRPLRCRGGSGWGHCLPFGGAIDCAADRAGRGPVGFAVAGSPFADLRFDARSLYAAGYPALRLVDFVDGLVWLGAADALRQTAVIPLREYAPTAAAIADLGRANPFDDRRGLARVDLEALWAAQAARAGAPALEVRWPGTADWRRACDPAAAG
jgi:hypothetical protein